MGVAVTDPATSVVFGSRVSVNWTLVPLASPVLVMVRHRAEIT